MPGLLTKAWMLAGLVCAGLGMAVQPAVAQTEAGSEEAASTEAAVGDVELRFADYEARLNALLRTRRQEEKKFVADVMEKVREGLIPVPLLESSFLWVRNNRPETPYPFVYFERVLRKQGELAEIEIPEFDYSVYSQRRQTRLSD